MMASTAHRSTSATMRLVVLLSAVLPVGLGASELIPYGKMQVEYFTEIVGDQHNSGVRYAPGNNIFGIKGSYDLDSAGMKSIAQFQLNTGSGRPCDHGASNMFGGIFSDWGTLLIGPHDAPTHIASIKTDLSARTLLSSCDILGAMGRNHTGIKYISPSVFGAQIVQLLPYSNDVITNDSATIYNNGPVYISLGDQEIQHPDGIRRYRTDFTVNMLDQNGLTLGFFYSWVRKDEGKGEAGLYAWPKGQTPERDAWRLEYGYAYRNGMIKIETGGAHEGDDGRLTRFSSAAFEYNFSKRRSVFTGQMRTVTQSPGRPVVTQTTFSHGLRLNF